MGGTRRFLRQWSIRLLITILTKLCVGLLLWFSLQPTQILRDYLFQNKDGLADKAQHLVIVAGHSVTVSDHLKDADSDENDWALMS